MFESLMNKNLKNRYDSLVQIYSEKMQKYNTLRDKASSLDFSKMSREDSLSFSDLFFEARDEFRAASEALVQFVLENKDHIKFE